MNKPQIYRDVKRGLMPWELVAEKMSEKVGKRVTPHQCRALENIAKRKLRKLEWMKLILEQVR